MCNIIAFYIENWEGEWRTGGMYVHHTYSRKCVLSVTCSYSLLLCKYTICVNDYPICKSYLFLCIPHVLTQNCFTNEFIYLLTLWWRRALNVFSMQHAKYNLSLITLELRYASSICSILYYILLSA